MENDMENLARRDVGGSFCFEILFSRVYDIHIEHLGLSPR
jgi:hypothetical protein